MDVLLVNTQFLSPSIDLEDGFPIYNMLLGWSTKYAFLQEQYLQYIMFTTS